MPLITADVLPSSTIQDGLLHGEVRMTNVSGMAIRLVGSGRAKCEGLIGIDLPFVLQPYEHTNLPCLLPWSSTTLFTSGRFPLNIEVDGRPKAIEVLWVVLR